MGSGIDVRRGFILQLRVMVATRSIVWHSHVAAYCMSSPDEGIRSMDDAGLGLFFFGVRGGLPVTPLGSGLWVRYL